MTTRPPWWRSVAGHGVLTGVAMGLTIGVIDGVMDRPYAWLSGMVACVVGGLFGALARWRHHRHPG